MQFMPIGAMKLDTHVISPCERGPRFVYKNSQALYYNWPGGNGKLRLYAIRTKAISTKPLQSERPVSNVNDTKRKGVESHFRQQI